MQLDWLVQIFALSPHPLSPNRVASTPTLRPHTAATALHKLRPTDVCCPQLACTLHIYFHTYASRPTHHQHFGIAVTPPSTRAKIIASALNLAHNSHTTLTAPLAIAPRFPRAQPRLSSSKLRTMSKLSSIYVLCVVYIRLHISALAPLLCVRLNSPVNQRPSLSESLLHTSGNAMSTSFALM